MILVFVIYFFLILRFTVTLFNFISNPKLTSSPRSYDDKISILVSLTGESHGLFDLLDSIKNQDYQNYEVIVLRDLTNKSLAENFTGFDERFKFLDEKDFKNIESDDIDLNKLASNATGTYLLFSTSDEVVFDGLINNSIHRMKIGRLALLSIFPYFIMNSFEKKAVLPLTHFLLLNLLPLRLVKLSKSSSFTAACENFMLFDGNLYRKHHWYNVTHHKGTFEVDIMREIKNQHYNTEALLSNGYLASNSRSSFKDLINKFARSLNLIFGKGFFALLLYLAMVIIGPVYLFLFLDLRLLLFAITLIILSRIMISLLSSQKVIINILLHPLQMAIFLVVSIVAITRRITGN